MDRMKTFGIYAIIIIAFFIFSNVMINIAIKSTYRPIDTYILNRESKIEIDITDAKATYVNGYIGGKVINNTQKTIDKKYIKIDIYSQRDVLLATRYVELNDWENRETLDFRMGFKLTNTEYFEIDIVDEVEENVIDEQFTSVDMNFAMLLTAVIILCYL